MIYENSIAGQVDERAAFDKALAASFPDMPAREDGGAANAKFIAFAMFQAGIGYGRAPLTPTAPQAASQQHSICHKDAGVCGVGGYCQDCHLGAPQAATTAACQPSTLTGQPDAAICQPAATTASASIEDDELQCMLVAYREATEDQAQKLRKGINAYLDRRAQAPSQSAPLEDALRDALVIYAESYECMARMKPGNTVDCTSVAYDIRRNMVDSVLAALARAPLPAQQDGAVDVARDAARYRFIEEHATMHGGGHGFTITCFVPVDCEDIGCGIDAAIEKEKTDA